MGDVAVDISLVAPRGRRYVLVPALVTAGILIAPAPLGQAAPGPPPQPPVPVIDGPEHHRRHESPELPPPPPPQLPPSAPS